MNTKKLLVKQLERASETLHKLDYETPDEDNCGQYSDLEKEINDFLIDMKE